mmetsp:Transcript_68588/g.135650  ORF Transcript_68588/g.135650 Transcript_68588/m.135650 type:complete len:81 (-) Transcript_68588:530-772(-)
MTRLSPTMDNIVPHEASGERTRRIGLAQTAVRKSMNTSNAASPAVTKMTTPARLVPKTMMSDALLFLAARDVAAAAHATM